MKRTDLIKFDSWLCRNIEEAQSRWGAMVFTVTAWWLWWWRNEKVFNEKAIEIYSKVHFLMRYFEHIRETMRWDAREQKMARPPVDRPLGWIRLKNDEWVLNVDVALGRGSKVAGCGGGGVLCNSGGEWRGGHACSMLHGVRNVRHGRF